MNLVVQGPQLGESQARQLVALAKGKAQQKLGEIQEDLGTDWVQETFGPMEPDTDDGDELCGVPPFPDRDERPELQVERRAESEQGQQVVFMVVSHTSRWHPALRSTRARPPRSQKEVRHTA